MDDNQTTHKLQQKDIEYLKDAVTKVETALVDGLAAINAKLDVLSEHYVRRDEMDRELAYRDEKINGLSDNQKWLVRSVIGIVIIALMGLILVNK